MKERLLSLMLCLTLTLSVFVGSVPDATAANGNSVVYTFGNPNGPFRDLAMRRREKSRKKEATEEAKREKAAKNQAAKERSRKRTAAKKEVDAP